MVGENTHCIDDSQLRAEDGGEIGQPLMVTSLKFDTIYVTAFDKVYSRKVKVTGVNTFAKPLPPKAPKL